MRLELPPIDPAMQGVEPIIDVDRETGELIQGWPRCRQAINTILTTRLRTRIMRLWWGSEFQDVQDRPGNQEVIMASLGDAAMYINLYEPEFRISEIIVNDLNAAGEVIFTVEGVYLPERSRRRVESVL